MNPVSLELLVDLVLERLLGMRREQLAGARRCEQRRGERRAFGTFCPSGAIVARPAEVRGG